MVLNCWYDGFSQKAYKFHPASHTPQPCHTHTHTNSYTLPQPIPVKRSSTYLLVLLTWVLALPREVAVTHTPRHWSALCVCGWVYVYTQSLSILWQRSQGDLFKELQTWGNEMRTWDLKGGNRKRSFVHLVRIMGLGECGLGTQTPWLVPGWGNSQTTVQGSRLQKGHIGACLLWVFSANRVSQVRERSWVKDTSFSDSPPRLFSLEETFDVRDSLERERTWGIKRLHHFPTSAQLMMKLLLEDGFLIPSMDFAWLSSQMPAPTDNISLGHKTLPDN